MRKATTPTDASAPHHDPTVCALAIHAWRQRAQVVLQAVAAEDSLATLVLRYFQALDGWRGARTAKASTSLIAAAMDAEKEIRARVGAAPNPVHKAG